MTKSILLRLHRWTSLLFALPLLVIILTGLILSFEPVVQTSGIGSHSLDSQRVIDLIKRYDPESKARGLSLNAAAQRLTLRGMGLPAIDLATSEPMTATGSADVFLWARMTHERLLGQAWLVTTSTIAMVAIMTLGIFMGWPRLRNSLSGWHKGAAWFTLPLILLSPLTGLCMAFGLTFQESAPPPARGRPISLTDAVAVVGQARDLAQVSSIAMRGGRMMLRIFENGELRAYAVTANGLDPLPRNWPRLLHEGNWSKWLASAINVVISVVLLGLLITGLLIWTRRQLRGFRRA